MASETTDIRNRVELATGHESAAAQADTPQAPLTLKQRLAAIRDECAEIGKSEIKMKTKAGIEYTIKAHTIEAVLAEIRPLIARFGVDLSMNLVERSYSGNRCDIIVDFMFSLIDEPAERQYPPAQVGDPWVVCAPRVETIRWAGAGTDDGDKGFSKAGTNALKEMLKKRFLISSLADAEDESTSVEHQPDGGATRREVDETREQRRGAIEAWARTFKVALEKASTAKDIQRLERENRTQMENEDLPEVTRDFFNELIANRKAAIGK